MADRWYDRSTRAPAAASEEGLLATTLAAQVAAEPGTRVTVIGLNPAHARIFAGTHDARLFWMDRGGQFAANEPPDWLPAFNAANSPDNAHNAKWMVLNAAAGAPPLRVLTYSPDHPAEFLALYQASPFGQAAQFDLASEIIVREHLGQGDTLDFLCILSGATALLGYETGARSPLMRQLMLRLDLRLEAFLNQLSETPGESAFAFVLAGGHGAPPVPDPDMRALMAVNGTAVAQAAESGLAGFSGVRIEKYIYPFLYLNTGSLRDPEPARLAAARGALSHPAVAGYYTAGDACSTYDAWERRFRNSFHPRRSGSVMLAYRPEFVEAYGADRGISYGSLYNYDARVPLMFYGPQFRAARFESPVESVDLAPTLASVMGVPPPSSSTGRVLSEALQL